MDDRLLDAVHEFTQTRKGIDADAAFKTLRQASMDGNRKLRDIAQEIVTRPENS